MTKPFCLREQAVNSFSLVQHQQTCVIVTDGSYTVL